MCRMIVIIVNCNILNSSDNNIFKQHTFICESTVNIHVQKSYMEFILSVISETKFFCKEAFRFKSKNSYIIPYNNFRLTVAIICIICGTPKVI